MLRRLLSHPVPRRILAALATLLGVAVFVFIMLRAIPGNQITAGLGTEAAALTPRGRAVPHAGQHAGQAGEHQRHDPQIGADAR